MDSGYGSEAGLATDSGSGRGAAGAVIRARGAMVSGRGGDQQHGRRSAAGAAISGRGVAGAVTTDWGSDLLQGNL